MDSTSQQKSSRKAVYKGTFNWHGEVFILHKRAHTALQAYKIMCSDLANRLGMTAWSVRQYFSDDKDRHSIERLIDKARKE